MNQDPHVRRKIAAILAADIAGYSRLIAEDEEETLRRLAVYRGVLEDFVSRANGRIFNTAGDGFLAEFPSAVDAVRCAIDVQESLRTRNLAYPPSRQMSFRMGLTIGDVVDRDGDLLGDGVNIAARLQTLAEPGRICISKSVHDAVANKLSVNFTDLGAQQVKNIPNPVHCFGVATGSESPPTQATAGDQPRTRAPISSSGFGPVPLAAAVVIALLAGAGVAWISADILWPAKKTTTVAASKPVDASPLPPSSNPVAQEPVKTTVATSPAPGAEPETPPQPQPDSKPSSLETTPPTETVPAKSAPSTTVAATEPSSSPALSSDDVAATGRLRATWWTTCKGSDPSEAAEACHKLIADSGIVGADLALAHEKLAFAERQDGKLDDSIASFTKSIGIAESTEAYNERGTAFFLKGQMDDAVADYDRAIALDGNNGDAYNNRAWAYYKQGKIKDAKQDADKAEQLIPNKADVWDTRGYILEALGDRAEALKSFQKALSIDPSLESSKAGVKRLGAQ